MTDRSKTLAGDEAAKGERVAKVIARAGLCSRREAEVLIAAGRVELDGATVVQPGTVVRPGQRVTVDGEALPALEPPRLFRLHKPAGVLTTSSDPEGRRTIYDLLPGRLPRLMPVGRLDINSEGLLLLTNDGGLKRHLELPATGWLRRYRVRAFGTVEPAALTALADGITIEGVRYGGVEARLENQARRNVWLSFALREGKNREVRRICEHLGLKVNRLIRIAYGPFQLGALAEGALEEVPAKVLREQLGMTTGLPGLAPPQRQVRKALSLEPSKAPAARGEGWAQAKPRKPSYRRSEHKPARQAAEGGFPGAKRPSGRSPGDKGTGGKTPDGKGSRGKGPAGAGRRR